MHDFHSRETHYIFWRSSLLTAGEQAKPDYLYNTQEIECRPLRATSTGGGGTEFRDFREKLGRVTFLLL